MTKFGGVPPPKWVLGPKTPKILKNDIFSGFALRLLRQKGFAVLMIDQGSFLRGGFHFSRTGASLIIPLGTSTSTILVLVRKKTV